MNSHSHRSKVHHTKDKFHYIQGLPTKEISIGALELINCMDFILDFSQKWFKFVLFVHIMPFRVLLESVQLLFFRSNLMLLFSFS